MTEKYVAPKKRLRDRAAKVMRKRGWYDTKRMGSLRHRAYSLCLERHPWHDWGHYLMILVGQDFGGNWVEYSPPTWWYRHGTPKRMFRTGYPRHPLSTFEVIKDDYSAFRERTDGLNEDQKYEWKAIGTSQDGELHLGRMYWGNSFYGLTRWEMRLLHRYLWACRWRSWFGLRNWLYSLALHEAVDHKAPFKCNATPPPGSGGYSHWHCQQKRRHVGLHRFNNMSWGELDGEQFPVTHAPPVSKGPGVVQP